MPPKKEKKVATQKQLDALAKGRATMCANLAKQSSIPKAPGKAPIRRPKPLAKTVTKADKAKKESTLVTVEGSASPALVVEEGKTVVKLKKVSQMTDLERILYDELKYNERKKNLRGPPKTKKADDTVGHFHTPFDFEALLKQPSVPKKVIESPPQAAITLKVNKPKGKAKTAPRVDATPLLQDKNADPWYYLHGILFPKRGAKMTPAQKKRFEQLQEENRKANGIKPPGLTAEEKAEEKAMKERRKKKKEQGLDDSEED